VNQFIISFLRSFKKKGRMRKSDSCLWARFRRWSGNKTKNGYC